MEQPQVTDETVVVILGAESIDRSIASRIPENAYVITADSGLDHARSAGISPDVLVGDLDSISSRGLKWARKNVEIVAYPADKDDTDTELALELAAARHPARLIVISGGGDRLDHTLAVLGALARVNLTSIPTIDLWWATHDIRVVHGPGRTQVKPAVGSVLSLVALTSPCTGVSLTGTRWTLSNETLDALDGRGVSNIVEGDVELKLMTGVLALFHSREGSQ